MSERGSTLGSSAPMECSQDAAWLGAPIRDSYSDARAQSNWQVTAGIVRKAVPRKGMRMIHK